MFESKIDWGKLTENVNLDLSKIWEEKSALNPTVVGDSPEEQLLDSVFTLQSRENDPTSFRLLPIKRPKNITELALEQMEENFVWQKKHMFTSRIRHELEKTELKHENLGGILCSITDLILNEIDQVLEGRDVELYAQSLGDASADVEIVFYTRITEVILDNMDQTTLALVEEEAREAIEQQYISVHEEESELITYVEKRVTEFIGICP